MILVEDIMVDILKEIRRVQQERAKVNWDGSLYESVRKLQIDARGSVGERLVVTMLKELDHNVHYHEATTDDDKDWDFICNDLAYEVKTATLGSDGVTFQHENVYKSSRKYDGLILVDIAPNQIFMSIYPKNKIPFKELHFRKDSGFYKFDTHLRETRKNYIGDNVIETLEDFDAIFSKAEREIRNIKSQQKKRDEL